MLPDAPRAVPGSPVTGHRAGAVSLAHRQPTGHHPNVVKGGDMRAERATVGPASQEREIA